MALCGASASSLEVVSRGGKVGKNEFQGMVARARPLKAQPDVFRDERKACQ